MALDSVVIKITGDSKDLDKTIAQLEKVGKVDRQNAKSFKKTSKSRASDMDLLTSKAKTLGATLLGAFAIKQVVGSAINILKEFEKELSTLQSITGSTKKEMEFFEQAAKDVGRATKTAATDVVKAFTLIGSAQPELLKNANALAEVTKQSLILSKAAGIDATEAAKALTGAMNQFGVSANEAAKFTDIFATSQQKGSSFIQATSEALKNVGAAANAAGLTFETTNAAIQALAKGSLLGSEAGTALRGVLIKLSSQADNKINPSMVGLGETIDELAKRNLTLKDATKLVGQEGATGLLTLIKQNKIFKELDGNLNDVGNAMGQMAINTDNLDGSIDEAKNAWEELVLSFSESDGVLKDTADLITGLFRGLANGEFAITENSDSLKELTDNTLDNIEVLQDQVKSLEALLKLSIEQGNLENAEIFRKDLILKKTQLRLMQLKSEAEALDAKNKAEKEAAEALAKTASAQAKQLGAFGALKKRINELNKELQDQALLGNINTATLGEYKKAVRQADEAIADLDRSLEDALKTLPLMNTELDKLFIRDVPFIEQTTALEDFFSKHQSGIDNAIQAEQSLFRIVAQINTNKLIALDNEETKALRALDAEGLGEQELAQKRQEIQVKADEERAKILTKQAKADKVAAIFDATINTATAVSKALASTANPVFAAVIGALGLAEIAVIASQPIPVFHTGKKPELAEGEMFAKILKSESVIPPEQSKRYKGAIDSMIDKNFESYVMSEYMLPMMKGMIKKDASPYDDIHIWNNQKKQIKLTSETNHLLRNMTRSLEPSNRRRSWNG